MKSRYRAIAIIQSIFVLSAIVCGSVHASSNPYEVDAKLTAQVGVRLITINYVFRDGQHTTGSGFLIDAQHALTAAHLIKDVDPNIGMVIQVGALDKEVDVDGYWREPYLTTGKVLTIDTRRDLALIEVHTNRELNKFPICATAPSGGAAYLLASTGIKTNGRLKSLHAQWRPLWRYSVLDLKSFAGPPNDMPPIENFHLIQGDPVVAIDLDLNKGDSGGALISEAGCLFGIVSFHQPLKEAVGIATSATFATPIVPTERLLK